MKKPKRPPAPPIAPPADLSERAKALWESAVADGTRSPGRLVLVQEALYALDRADQARALLTQEGLATTTKTTGAVHLHPAAKLERESRALFSKLWAELGFRFNVAIDSRPSLLDRF